MINFKMIDRGIPRNGYDICNKEGDKIGNVTSGTFSPTNKVGMIGYVNIKHSLGDEIYLLIRDKLVKAEITKLPLKMGRAFEFRKARKLKRWSTMAKTFTRIGKDISVSVKEGGPNPESNSRLRAIIQNAKVTNMKRIIF